jgi:hypothetical protein
MRSAKICYGWLWSILILVLLSPLPLSSQTTSEYSCIVAAQVSVDASCQYVIDPATLLIGDSIPDNLRVFVFDKDPSNREIVECPGTYNYSITTERNAIICWGLITLIDDQGPTPVDTIQTLDTLECAQINKILNNPNTTLSTTIGGQANPYYLGKVRFEENCTSCNCDVDVKFFDQVDFFPCDSLPYYARITRRWTASDCENNLTQVEQFFHLVRPDFDELQMVPDQDIQTCSPEEVIIEDLYPFWIDVFGDTLYLNEIDCNLDIQLIGQSLSECEGQFNQIQREVQVFDWCTGDTIIVDNYRIRYGDLAAPNFKEKAINLPETNTLSELNTSYLQSQINTFAQQGLVTELSLGPMDCSISFPLNQDFLQQQFSFEIEDCNTSTYQFSFYSYRDTDQWQYSEFNTPFSQTGAEVKDIPPGMHAMAIEAGDQCGNLGKGLILFFVRDRIAPLAKCVDELNILIQPQANNEYYQTISISDIDQGSEDNCQLDRSEMRRVVPNLTQQLPDLIALGYDTDQNGQITEADFFDANQNGRQDPQETNWSFEAGQWYSPWANELHFLCSDVNQAVDIQARFFDQATEPLSGKPSPNLGQCWLTVSVEDTSKLSISPLPDFQLDCSDPLVDLLNNGTYSFPQDSILLTAWRAKLGTPIISGNFCSAFSVRETINNSLDNCGFGEITRTIIVETPGAEGPIITSVQQSIVVRERYDYWIKFPGDIQANCSAGIVDSGYLEIEEEHCDLLAVTYTDDYLYAPQDADACFKIFRTYQVINWCEYDGQSPPVIVSRDWDNWNGESCGQHYNINPGRPDGNNQPGDSDLYVIVHRNFNDDLPDTVYYDIDADPHNAFPDNPQTTDRTEGYWWKVISGTGMPGMPAYDELPVDCGLQKASVDNVWGNTKEPKFGSIGFWQYTQHLLVYDDIFPEVSIGGSPFICGEMRADCLIEVELSMTISDQCIGSNNLDLEIWFDKNRDGQSLVDYSASLEDTLFRAALPLGNHSLIIWADDNCGNRIRQVFNMVITDCTAPKPDCREGLVVDLISDGDGGAIANVSATDFIQTPLFDCAGQGPREDGNGRLQVRDFSINRKGNPVDRSQTSLSLNCNQLANAEFLVEIHAWDENDQHDFCESILQIRDTDQYCPHSTGMIAGTILTEDQRFIQNADVSLSGPQAMLYLSDENGKYAFDFIETNNDYTVSPSLNSGFLNGISTRDILLIQNHILGRDLLDSPYKLIAADVNNSKAISTLDLIELRKLILSVDLRFENNSSWRFIPAQYRFPDPTNPWQTNFPEIININNLKDSLMSVDFIGIKIGDVSGNVDPATTLSLDERSQSHSTLYFTDRRLLPGQLYEIPIQANLEQFAGMQFTLSVDPQKAILHEVIPAAFAQNNYRIHAERGWLVSSWLQSESSPEEIVAGVCFKIALVPKKEVMLSELLTLTDHWVRSEAYIESRVEALKLLTTQSQRTSEAQVSIKTVYPNPFQEETRIIFQNPRAQKLSIQVFTALGQLVQQTVKNYDKGEHIFDLRGGNLPQKGVYLVKIKGVQIEQSHRIIYH